ncbi:hypothetical protein [Asanoa siamensis]|uniref:hypothetical protein n=1 Tax=Asanoa siamensis TaxID=926357 RepID=UPI0019445F6D|nr:hypothetical protein [Asanoa siamensis]
MHPRHPDPRRVGEVFEAAGGGVLVHPDLAALAAYAYDAVAVFLAEVGDVRPAGFEDPQAEQGDQGDQGEVVRVRRCTGGGDQGFELQVAQSGGRLLSRHGGAADVVGRQVFQEGVDDADPVEADHDRQPPGDRRGLVSAYLLQPAHISLDVDPARGQTG